MKKILCWFGNHDFRVVKQLSKDAQLIHCIRCKGSYAINHDVKIVLPFGWEMKMMYQRHGQKNLDKWISYRPFSLWY